MLSPHILFLFLPILFLRVAGLGLSNDVISAVRKNLADAAKETWELGTRAQALLEIDTPTYSVFSSKSLPPPTSNAPATLSDVFSIAQSIVSNRSRSNSNIQGPQPLIADGSAADPASNGVAVLLANWTGHSNGVDYAGAARDQLEFLLQVVPRTSDGAISHRVSQVQLWSDFVYMVPPFLAYYGAITKNQTLLALGYSQIRLYRNYLRDGTANSLWKHVVMGSDFSDTGHWSTGNGWAAAGMLRVLATIQRSSFANNMKNEQKDLANWVQEIHDGMYKHLNTTTMLFTNYADQDPSQANFADASSTALLASTVYRIALLWGVHKHIPMAEKCRLAIFGGNSSDSSVSSSVSSAAKSLSSFLSTASGEFTLSSSSPAQPASSSVTSPPASSAPPASGSQPAATSPPPGSPPASTPHVSPRDLLPSSSGAVLVAPTPISTPYLDSSGWLAPVVNPHSFGEIGSHSAEGQAFVLELEAAWRDWVADGSKGINRSRKTMDSTRINTLCAGALVMVGLSRWLF